MLLERLLFGTNSFIFGLQTFDMTFDSNLQFSNCSELKERIKKTKDEKKAKKAEVTAKSQKVGKGNVPKSAGTKGPKLGGGGGKR